ncbi:hypothetical protein DV515_00019690, partial [Chloebia gouldiae]
AAPFDWQDALGLEGLLSAEERLLRDTTRKYCQERLLPRVLHANRHEAPHESPQTPQAPGPVPTRGYRSSPPQNPPDPPFAPDLPQGHSSAKNGSFGIPKNLPAAPKLPDSSKLLPTAPKSSPHSPPAGPGFPQGVPPLPPLISTSPDAHLSPLPPVFDREIVTELGELGLLGPTIQGGDVGGQGRPGGLPRGFLGGSGADGMGWGGIGGQGWGLGAPWGDAGGAGGGQFRGMALSPGVPCDSGVLEETPQRYGCAGTTSVGYGLVARELERVDSSYRSVLSVQSSLVMYPLWAYGTPAQRQRFLPRLGETPGAGRGQPGGLQGAFGGCARQHRGVRRRSGAVGVSPGVPLTPPPQLGGRSPTTGATRGGWRRGRGTTPAPAAIPCADPRPGEARNWGEGDTGDPQSSPLTSPELPRITNSPIADLCVVWARCEEDGRRGTPGLSTPKIEG